MSQYSICDFCGGKVYTQANTCQSCLEEALLDSEEPVFRSGDLQKLEYQGLKALDAKLAEAKETGEDIKWLVGILEGSPEMKYYGYAGADGSLDFRFEL